MQSQARKMIQQLSKEVRDLEEKAYKNPRTGLYRLGYFKRILSQKIQQAETSGDKLALCLYDIDRFKRINDQFSHQVADSVITQFADRLKSEFRLNHLCRYSQAADEFLTLCEDATEKQAVLDDVQSILRLTNEPFTIQGHQISIDVSIGVSIFPDDAQDVSELIEKADGSMYYAKNDPGEKPWAFYGDLINENLEEISA